MGISLAPDPTTGAPPVDPTKPKVAPAPGVGVAPAAPATSAPLPTEYPSAPSTTGTPQNRLQLATTAFDTFAKSTAPQYTADLRQATQQAAGNGQIGSGGLRTTYGNLANQRALALDTERSNLINSATTGTIADQQAATANSIAQQNADTAKAGTIGNLGVAQGQLGLAQTANAQQYGLATAAQAVQTQVQLGQLSLAQAAQALDDKVKTGELTVDQANQALAVINSQSANTINQQNANTASAAQQSTATNQAGTLALQQQQLAQTGQQFGLSLAQQKDLATLADATQNRQIDASTAQGQNALLLQLANIIGGPAGTLDPNFVQAVIKALGFSNITAPAGTPSVNTTPTVTTGDQTTRQTRNDPGAT